MSAPGPCGAAGRRQGGYTYLWVLIAVAVLGVGLVAQAEVGVASTHRARMAQADWAGAQYARAIASYFELAPGGVKAFPLRLDELTEDRRGPTVRRHLRQLYPNPLSGDGRWTPIRAAGGAIVGVRLQLPDGQGARDYVHAAAQASARGGGPR